MTRSGEQEQSLATASQAPKEPVEPNDQGGSNASVIPNDRSGANAPSDPNAVLHALVLSGGGARGAYQAGLLAGLAQRLGEDFPFPVLTGVSAGAINAATLASSRRNFAEATENLADAWRSLSIERVFRTSFGSLTWSFMRWLWMLGTGGLNLSVKGIFNTDPLAKYLQATLRVEGIGENIAKGRLQALGLSCTCYGTGQTVTFVQGREGLKMWRRARRHALAAEITTSHIMASAALPLLFPAIGFDGDYYGDGSIRQSSPLAPAIHLGANRLLTISTRATSPTPSAEKLFRGYPPPAQIMGLMMNSVFLDALENDAERLNRINRTLHHLPSDFALPDRLRPIELLVLRPSKDLGKLAHGLTEALPRTLRILVQGLGSGKTKSPDFLSYILFERPYIERLIELGQQDAQKHWPTVQAFFSKPSQNPPSTRTSDTPTAPKGNS